METWREIPNFSDYAVSDAGQVKRITRSRRNVRPRMLKPKTTSDGYRAVVLYRDGSRFHCSVHRLVGLAFLGDESQLQINHKNGIRNDNRLENLEWVTPSENKKHAYRTGITLRPIGENNGCSKITECQAAEIKRRVLAGEKISPLAREFGLTHMAVKFIKTGKNWSHVQV